MRLSSRIISGPTEAGVVLPCRDIPAAGDVPRWRCCASHSEVRFAEARQTGPPGLRAIRRAIPWAAAPIAWRRARERLRRFAGAHRLARAPQSAAPKPADRFIIAAVDQSTAADLMARAGSTPRGYEAVTALRPGARARKTMRALEKEYGLREVNAWPIEPLHVHCAVLRDSRRRRSHRVA